MTYDFIANIAIAAGVIVVIANAAWYVQEWRER